MADSQLPPPLAPPVFARPEYKDPIRFPLVESLEHSFKKEFRAHLIETAQELLTEMLRA